MVTKPLALIDTRVTYCGDNFDQLRKFPAACVDLVYIGPPFNSNADYSYYFIIASKKTFRLIWKAVI